MARCPVAEMIDENRQRELLRAFAFIGPFKAVAGEALDAVMLIERLAVDRDDEPVDGALSLVNLRCADIEPCVPASRTTNISHV